MISQLSPYTVFAWEAVGEVAEMLKPVVETVVTAGPSAANASVEPVISTTGAAGRVTPNVTVTRTPVAAPLPVPQVSEPRKIVDPAATTGAGGLLPAFAPAAAVTVVLSQGE